MSEYSAGLKLRVSSHGVEAASSGLRGIEQNGTRAERATDRLAATFQRLIGPVAAFVSVSAGLRQIVEVTRQYEVFKASLETATGSVESAGMAFQALEAFAARTPFALEQSVQAFVKLTNLGLTPSERAMTSYGDTASAMGKSLNQMIEAVADAATGEFERLKEFGIKASQQGDKVSFTFKGVTTTVKKNAEDIQEYMLQLGENNFAGNMAKRMEGLDGALSNLGDNWDALFRTISEQGTGDLIKQSVNLASEAIEGLNRAIGSGQIEQSIKVIGAAFAGFEPLVNDATQAIKRAFEFWGDAAASVNISEYIDADLEHLPENVRTAVKLMVIELATFVDYGTEYGAAFGKALGVEFAKIVDKAGIYAKELQDQFKFMDGDTFDMGAALTQADTIAAEMTDSFFREAEKQVAISRQARMDSITYALAERDAVINAVDEKVNKLDELGRAYDAEQSKRAASLDDIPINKPSRELTATGSPEIEKLILELRSEEQVIDDSYTARRKIIVDNTRSGSELQLKLLSANWGKYETEFQEHQDKIFDIAQKGNKKVAPTEEDRDWEKLINNLTPPAERINQAFDESYALIEKRTVDDAEKRAMLIGQLNKDFATDVIRGFEVKVEETDFSAKADKINEDFAAQRQLVLDNTRLTEEARTNLELELTEWRAQQIQQIEEDKLRARLSITKSMLGNLSSLMNSESKKAFEVGKVAAIANATISGIEAIVHSYKFGAQIGGPVLGAAFAATAAAATTVQIQQLKSQQFGGGGSVSAGGGGAPNVYQPPQPTIPVGPVGGDGQRPINLIIHKDFNGKIRVEQLADELKDYIEDADYVLVSSTSRNGRELAA